MIASEIAIGNAKN